MYTHPSHISRFEATKRIVLAVIILIALAMLSSCEFNHVEEALPAGAINTCDTLTVNFNSDIVPILIANCATASCHDGTGDDPDLSSDAYTNLAPSLGDGKFKSKVIDNGTMPPSASSPLNSNDYQKIKCWFESGHTNN